MIRRNILNKAIVSFVVLSISGTNQSASASYIEPAGSVRPSNRRWLTYACSSKEGRSGGRRLISRLLLHPCNNQSRQSTSTNSLYDTNTSRGSNTIFDVTLGIIAGIVTLLGILFFIDRETFKDVTGMEEIPIRCKCAKPRIDDDDGGIEKDITPYEMDKYLTEETVEYLKQKHSEEVEQPKRRLRNIFWCCFRPKDYDNDDKYRISSSVSQEGNSNKLKVFLEEIRIRFEDFRLRLFWRPTKKYSDRDKYDVEGDDDDVVKYAASSYESAGPDAAPW